jgi:hypothetical protein
MEIRSKQTGVVLPLLYSQIGQYTTGYFGSDKTQTFDFRSVIVNSAGTIKYINAAIAPKFNIYWD